MDEQEELGMHQQENENMYIVNNVEQGIDESTFMDWKNELQKNLPSFWQSMQ